MGLGKTLQVIAFLHCILSHQTINKHIKTALVICPVNTIRNWANEFRIWLNDNDLDNILVFEMTDAKTLPQRAELMRIWKKRGGVLIMGLTLFSMMVQGGRGRKPSKSVREAIETCLLDPGPDVVICDEGHLLKNEKTAYNKAVSKLKTLRRVVLTGTPLQNNLIEYHVMVHFVKPNLLGTKKEFTNRFVNPITNGQHVDSTDYDVKIMKKRVHILHTLLNGCVHRCDYSVLVPYLQPKFEFVLSVRMSDIQHELYKFYIENLTDKQRMSLLADYGVLRLVWNHPSLLYEQHQRKLDKAAEEEDSMEEFIDDDDIDTPVSGDSDIECMDDDKAGTSKPVRRRIRTRYGKADNEEEEQKANNEENEIKTEENSEMSNAWFAKYMKREESNKIELSGKFILLFSILEECEKMGDKILLFTQSLDTLDLVEEFLRLKSEEAKNKDKDKIEEIDLENSYKNDLTNTWVRNIDYFRIDGSTGSDYRKAWIDIFNDENNYRARLFLLSTKAGGLGINLVGANRCIIFDASWNPTHDVQAIFRIFRFGQKKPVYVYRFVAQATMEEKIYERQIIKQSLACRVIDEQQIQRHFKASELSELYVYNPDRNTEQPTPVLPKDRLLAELLIKHKKYIVNYHEHDSLLENKPEEEMTEEEKQMAWNEYEQDRDNIFLKEQQEREMRLRQEYLYAQQQQYQQQQQQQYQQQQQQYAQQIYQQFAQQFANSTGNPTNFANLLQSQIYQNILKSQATIRRQQQSQQHLRQHVQQPVANSSQSGLPGYDVMTVEDIAHYVRNLNKNIDTQTLVERIFHIITVGLSTCQNELANVKVQVGYHSN
jgi:transcriptional regulator ATRX